jgi:hypothetical protein
MKCGSLSVRVGTEVGLSMVRRARRLGPWLNGQSLMETVGDRGPKRCRPDDSNPFAPPKNPPDDLEFSASCEGKLNPAIAKTFQPQARMPLPFFDVGSLVWGGTKHDLQRLFPRHAEVLGLETLGVKRCLHPEGFADGFKVSDALHRQGDDVAVLRAEAHVTETAVDGKPPIRIEWIGRIGATIATSAGAAGVRPAPAPP